MLIRFKVSNFLSFKDETEFNMLTGNYKIHKSHVYRKNNINLVKAAAIYGANGAGKSNLVKAIHSFQEIIITGEISFQRDAKFRLDEKYRDMPVSFEMEFSTGKNIYLYKLLFDENRIHLESLIKTNGEKDELIYERKTSPTKKNKIILHSKYLKTQKDKILLELYEEELLLNNQIYLHYAQRRKYGEISEAFKWLTDELIIIYPSTMYQFLTYQFEKINQFQKFINLLLPTLDTGIKSIQVQTIPLKKYLGEDDDELFENAVSTLDKGEPFIKIETGEDYHVIALKENDKYVVKKLKARHNGNNQKLYDFNLIEESDGTLRLFDIMPALFACIYTGSTVIVDEIDSSLHPYLLKKIIELFMTLKSTGQLIFTTHESNLLDLNILRQDEIWFVEKDKSGATNFSSLNDFKPRYDTDIRKGYLNGRFGAIPFLGNLTDLNWQTNGQSTI